MLNSKKNMYLILTVTFVIFAIITYIIISLTWRKNNKKNGGVNIPTVAIPTDINKPSTSTQLSPKTSPTIAPTDFTGANPKISIDPKEQKSINEEVELRHKSPVKTQYFTITFNYVDDVFEVQLKKDREKTKNEFEKWRGKNYPDISLQRFRFIK